MTLTERQFQIAQRVARGESVKRIARDMAISVRTVRQHIHDAGARLPGDGTPMFKLIVFVISDEDKRDD